MPKRPTRKSRRLAPAPQSQILTGLSSGQEQLLAEILGNVAVAWFTAGVIAPIFLEVESLKLVFSAGLGILFTGIFIGLALYITNK